MAEAKYPDIKVKLAGTDGNAFAVMGVVVTALRKGGVSKEERDQYMAESTAGDYSHLLATVYEWVTVR